MHELPVTTSILNIALRHAEEAKATRITDLYLRIGDLSSIVDDSIQFYWDIISRNTIAEGATLHFERIPMQMICLECGQVYHPTPESFDCTACGSQRVTVAGGDEFQLTSIDIERDETHADATVDQLA